MDNVVSGYINDGSRILIKVTGIAPKFDLRDGRTIAILYKDDNRHWYSTQSNQ